MGSGHSPQHNYFDTDSVPPNLSISKRPGGYGFRSLPLTRSLPATTAAELEAFLPDDDEDESAVIGAQSNSTRLPIEGKGSHNVDAIKFIIK